MTTNPTDTLTFDAELVAVKLRSKASPYGTGSASGEIDVTFRIARPAPPREPYAYGGSEPEEDDYTEPKTFKAAHGRWEKQTQEYQAELAKCEQAKADLTPRLRSYASIAGMAAVLDGQTVTVVIRPGVQQFLAGFGVELLDVPDSADAYDERAADNEDLEEDEV